jgi:hypothetical protein
MRRYIVTDETGGRPQGRGPGAGIPAACVSGFCSDLLPLSSSFARIGQTGRYTIDSPLLAEDGIAFTT